MAAGLESCPAEIIESIVERLDVSDAGNLRLTNRCICYKATQRHFKSYFRCKRVDVTRKALRELQVLTQPGWLGCGIHHLTLVGVVNNTKGLESYLEANGKPQDPKKRFSAARDLQVLQERRQDYQQALDSGEIVQTLSEAFDNVAAAKGRLASLSLSIVVYREDAEQRLPPIAGGSWRLIWQTAAETFRVVFASLQASKLEVNSLNIFNSPQLQRCSLACDELSSVDYGNTLAGLKSLSISVSQRIIDITPTDKQWSGGPADTINWSDNDSDRDMDEVMAEAEDEKNFIGLANLLRTCSQLQSVQVHQYLVNAHRINHIDILDERLFQRIAELNTLLPPDLEHCCLQGVFVREQDLLSFLKRVNLRRLSLEHVTMTSGTFRSIFNYCTSEASRMEFLYVDEVLIQRDLLSFAERPKYQPGVGGHTLSREGEAMKQPIIYSLPDGRFFPVDSPQTRQWVVQRRREFGPP